MPNPHQWRNSDLLVQDLNEYDWRKWFETGRQRDADSDLRVIVRKAVEGNTFRAFHKLPQKPSGTFREWAFQALACGFFASFLEVSSQEQYDSWLSSLVQSFQDCWNAKMKCSVPYGPSFKLPNLLVKRLCLYYKVPMPVFNRVVWFLHVPLDSYTIQAVKNCVETFPDPKAVGKIPGSATMSFVKNPETYTAFQTGIKALAKRAKVPPITLDCCAWDAGHNKAQIFAKA